MRREQARPVFFEIVTGKQRQQFFDLLTIHRDRSVCKYRRQYSLIFRRAELICERTVVELDCKIRATSSVENPSISRSTIEALSLKGRLAIAREISSRRCEWIRTCSASSCSEGISRTCSAASVPNDRSRSFSGCRFFRWSRHTLTVMRYTHAKKSWSCLNFPRYL